MVSEIVVDPNMASEIRRDAGILFACDACGFLYNEKFWAEKCQEYCAAHGACSLKITSQAISGQLGPGNRPKALALLSGGLDSMLAAKVVVDRGVEVEAVHFLTPFSKHDDRFVHRFCEELGIKLHRVSFGQEYLDMLVSPQHGYGSQMNPCIDCRICAFKQAKELARKIGADFLVTGEVLDERPFSQRRATMLLIEKEAGLEGKILRPLSAKLLPESDPEKEGMVNREELFAIRGRRRTPQIELAKKLGIEEYPTPSGGCLLTDPRFADRLKEHLKHEGRLSLADAEFLKIGRHFRVNKCKVIVGRNKEENERLQSIAEKQGLATMEVVGHKGPLAVLVGEAATEEVSKAAAITARYSDAPKEVDVRVQYGRREGLQVLKTNPIEDGHLRGFII